MKEYIVKRSGLSRKVGEKFTEKELTCCSEHATNTDNLVSRGYLEEVK